MKPKAGTLFHFTKSSGTLQQILRSGFWPRFCLEDIAWIGSSDFQFMAYPMVCFCDIPISRINEHVGFYGEFGIGLTKDWAFRNGLNPLLYVSGDNTLSKSILEMMGFALKLGEDDQKTFTAHFRHLNAHIKPTSGRMVVAGEPITKDFYSESEWRYMPQDERISDFIQKSQFENTTTLEAENAKTKEHCTLKFTPSDVRYIFVPTDSEIPEIMNFIQAQMDHFPGADQKLLMSRVTSLESLRADV